MWLLADPYAFRWDEGSLRVAVYRCAGELPEGFERASLVCGLDLPHASVFEFVAAACGYMEPHARPALTLLQGQVPQTTDPAIVAPIELDDEGRVAQGNHRAAALKRLRQPQQEGGSDV